MLDAVSELYSHKEVIDLFGNGFAASSLMTAILWQLTLAVKLGRIVPPLAFRIFIKLIQYISTCILVCSSTAYFDFLDFQRDFLGSCCDCCCLHSK